MVLTGNVSRLLPFPLLAPLRERAGTFSGDLFGMGRKSRSLELFFRLLFPDLGDEREQEVGVYRKLPTLAVTGPAEQLTIKTLNRQAQ